MTIEQLSMINSPSGRGRDALGIILEESPFLRWLNQNSGWEEDATDFDWLPEPIDEFSVENRAVGESYTGIDVTPGTRETDSLAIHGGSVDIDITHEADASRGLRDVPAWFTKELRNRMRSFAHGYESLLFNGDGQTNNIRGLINILDGSDLTGYTGIKQLVNAAIAGAPGDKSLDISDTDNYSAWLELLMNQLSLVDNPTGILMNKEMYARFWTMARKEQMLGESRDLFGRPVPTFNGVPFVKLYDGTITNYEPDDTTYESAVLETTSIYIASPGEERVSLVSNSGLYWMDYNHVDNKESGREKFEIRAKWKIQKWNSILRIRNIKLGTPAYGA
jgi:hypothetical protein